MKKLKLLFLTAAIFSLTSCATLNTNRVEVSMADQQYYDLVMVVTNYIRLNYKDKNASHFIIKKDGKRLSELLWVRLRAYGYQVKYGEFGRNSEGKGVRVTYLLGKFGEEILFTPTIGLVQIQQTFERSASGRLAITSPLGIVTTSPQQGASI